MADQEHAEDPDLLGPGHPAIFSKPRKSSTRRKSPTKQPEHKPSLSDLFKLPIRQNPEGSDHRDNGTTGRTSVLGSSDSAPPAVPEGFLVETPWADADQQEYLEKQKTEGDPERDALEGKLPIKEYSNEARAYHARYAELSRAHDEGRHDECREGCLDLLTEPRLPKYTRIQILQMVSTLFHPNTAENCLQEAATILKDMDQSHFQVQLLLQDNNRMLADIQVWRDKKGVRAGDDDAMEVDEDEDEDDLDKPSDKYWDFDREWQKQLQEELAEELEHVGFNPAVQTGSTEEGASAGGDGPAGGVPFVMQQDAGQLPSPEQSDEEL